MGGTIGWILAAWPFMFILVDWAKVQEANPQGLGRVARDGARLGPDGPGAAGWHALDVHRRRRRVAAAGGIQPGAAAHAAEASRGRGRQQLAWLEAMKLLKHPFVLVLFLVTFVDAFVHNSYFNWTGVFLGTPTEAGGVGIPGNWIMPVMSIGQIAEILTMAVLGATLQAPGLADDDDHRHPRPRGPLRRLRVLPAASRG